jgi:hypothetical protein
MASEFLPLQELITRVHSSMVKAGETIDRGEGEVRFAIGECTFSISLELDVDGEEMIARHPSFVEGERVPPEYLSRVSFVLRPSVPLEER